MRDLGHAVGVVTSDYGVAGRRTAEPHVARILRRPQDSASLFEIARWEIQDDAALRRSIEEQRPDVIYAWGLQQLFASLHRTLARSGVPVVYNIQDLYIPKQLRADAERRAQWERPGSPGLNALVKPLVRGALARAGAGWGRAVVPEDLSLRHLVFVSAFQRAQHEDAGLPVADFRIIRNGLDTRRFAASRPPHGETLRALFVGRLVAEKGAHVAVKAVETLLARGLPIELTIAGIPAYPLEYGRALEAAAAASQGRVRLRAAVSQEDLPGLYAGHDVLVFPSRHREGLPMTVLEAMAAGLPVIATASGGTAEILSAAEIGLEVPEEDPAAVAQALERLGREPELARRLGTAGRAWVEAHCGLGRVVAETLEYLAGVAAAAC